MPRSQKLKLPYLKKLDQRGPLGVWLVNGSYIRTQLDIEFDNYGQHTDFDFIPKNELWLDQEANPDEQKFFIQRMRVERRLLQQGRDSEIATTKAIEAEKALSEKAGDLKRMRPKGQLP